MKTLSITDRPDNVSLRIMRAPAGLKFTWAAYKGPQDHLIFLAYGPGTEFKAPPLTLPSFPDYDLIGLVDLNKAQINELPTQNTDTKE